MLRPPMLGFARSRAVIAVARPRLAAFRASGIRPRVDGARRLSRPLRKRRAGGTPALPREMDHA